MLKLYAWCNVENPFTDSLYTDNMFSLIFFFTYYIMDILMHNEVYIWIPFKFLYFCCCFAFIQEYRLKNICLFWSVVILALFNVNEKNLGKPSYMYLSNVHTHTHTLTHTLCIYSYIIYLKFMCGVVSFI